MTTTDLVTYQDSFGADVRLSIADIKQTLCPTATDQEAAGFLHLCRSMGLNPFVRDAYLIKYGDKEASMVVGKDAFVKRADGHPQFSGMESGVIVQTGDKEPVNRKGTLVLNGESLVGGWARVARSDRKLDTDTTVAFKEFDTGRSMWAKMPGTMIEKVAIVKALRMAFPTTYSGLYDQAEMGIDMDANLEPVATSPILDAASVEVTTTEAPNGANHQAEMGIDESEVSGEIPPSCTVAGHEPGNYIVSENEATGARRWVHGYKYQLGGTERMGWCVYEGPVPVPARSELTSIPRDVQGANIITI